MNGHPVCYECVHWLGWQRPGADGPHISTIGDCKHPSLRGHLNGINGQTFYCAFWKRA